MASTKIVLIGAGSVIFSVRIAIQELAVEAAMTGSRQLALQALLLDPVVNSHTAAEAVLDELLAAHAEHLPRFAGTAGDRNR